MKNYYRLLIVENGPDIGVSLKNVAIWIFWTQIYYEREFNTTSVTLIMGGTSLF